MSDKAKNKVIGRKWLPTNWPLFETLILITMSDFYEWSGIVKVVVFTILVILWIGAVWASWNEDHVSPSDVIMEEKRLSHYE